MREFSGRGCTTSAESGEYGISDLPMTLHEPMPAPKTGNHPCHYPRLWCERSNSLGESMNCGSIGLLRCDRSFDVQYFNFYMQIQSINVHSIYKSK